MSHVKSLHASTRPAGRFSRCIRHAETIRNANDRQGLMNCPTACAAHQFDHLLAVDNRWRSSYALSSARTLNPIWLRWNPKI
jgi:hypothetical protein